MSSLILKWTTFNFESLIGFLNISLRANRISEPFPNQIFLLSYLILWMQSCFLPILVSPNWICERMNKQYDRFCKDCWQNTFLITKEKYNWVRITMFIDPVCLVQKYSLLRDSQHLYNQSSILWRYRKVTFRAFKFLTIKIFYNNEVLSFIVWIVN